MGRPSLYNPELAEQVLAELRMHGSTTRAAEAVGVDRATITSWCVLFPEFEPLYARAKAEGIDSLVEETLNIADAPPPSTDKGTVDTGAVAHTKLRIETRRWLAERMAPRKYGLRTTTELSGPDGGPVNARLQIVSGVPQPGEYAPDEMV